MTESIVRPLDALCVYKPEHLHYIDRQNLYNAVWEVTIYALIALLMTFAVSAF